MAYPWHENKLKSLLARAERLPHALLIRGPQGIGKLAFAEALASALLCDNRTAGRGACGRCTACKWVEQGAHPDLRRIEPASLAKVTGAEEAAEQIETDSREKKASSEIKINQVRAVADFINLTSHQGGMKVVLIHPAEALNIAASNALLKGLEEPPPQTCFIVVTHRWHQLLPTVRSRCLHVPLAPPALDPARAWLTQQGVPNPDLSLAHAGGAPLTAAGFDEEYWKRRGEFLKAISAKDMNALALADQLSDASPALVVGWLQKWTHDIACRSAGGPIGYNPDFAAAIGAVAARVEPLEATRFLRRMVRLQRIVAHPLNPRLFFEDLLLSYAGFVKGRPVELAA
jgi:DNA polymerase-3 subunit delta'